MNYLFRIKEENKFKNHICFTYKLSNISVNVQIFY